MNCKYEEIHIIGGGSKNKLLCQFTADALNIPVIAGPIEATAIGNALCQMIAIGKISDLSQAKDIVRKQQDVIFYEPMQKQDWNNAYIKYKTLQ